MGEVVPVYIQYIMIHSNLLLPPTPLCIGEGVVPVVRFTLIRGKPFLIHQTEYTDPTPMIYYIWTHPVPFWGGA